MGLRVFCAPTGQLHQGLHGKPRLRFLPLQRASAGRGDRQPLHAATLIQRRGSGEAMMPLRVAVVSVTVEKMPLNKLVEAFSELIRMSFSCRCPSMALLRLAHQMGCHKVLIERHAQTRLVWSTDPAVYRLDFLNRQLVT